MEDLGSMIQYKAIQALNPTDLEHRVGDYLQKGWKLAGGVSIAGGYSHPIYLQAMTKEQVEEGDYEVP